VPAADSLRVPSFDNTLLLVVLFRAGIANAVPCVPRVSGSSADHLAFVGREQAERAAREVRRERTVRSMLKLTAALALAGFAAACAAFFGARG